MKRCTFCGNEAPEEAIVCAIDGQPVLDPNASPAPVIEPQVVQLKPPVFGILSIVAPFCLFPSGMFFLYFTNITNNFPLELLGERFLLPLFLVMGLGFAVFAWRRQERYWGFFLAGFLFNFGGLIFAAFNSADPGWHM